MILSATSASRFMPNRPTRATAPNSIRRARVRP
jgi:hypothetical protein